MKCGLGSSSNTRVQHALFFSTPGARHRPKTNFHVGLRLAGYCPHIFKGGRYAGTVGELGVGGVSRTFVPMSHHTSLEGLQ